MRLCLSFLLLNTVGFGFGDKMAMMSRNVADVDGLIGWRDEQPSSYDHGVADLSYSSETKNPSLMPAAVGLFTLMIITISPHPVLHVVPKSFGVLLLLTYFIHMYRRRVRTCPEVKIYLAWVLWASLGLFWLTSASEQLLAVTALQTVFQICAMALIVSGFVRSKRSLSFVLFMFLVGAMIVGGYSWMTGEFRRIAEQLRGGERLSGMARNANAFAILMVYATACLAYFWMSPTRAFWLRWVKRAFIALCAVLMVHGTILSGSRKGLLAIALLYVLWVFFCYGRYLVRKPVILITVIFATVMLAGAVWGYVQTSGVGRRFDKAIDGYRRGGIAGGLGEGRSGMYSDAMRMIRENPVAGVGLNCYILRSHSQMVAHSEYAEIAADTGLVGAGIYFSWYVVFWIRLGRIRKWTKNRDRVVWQTIGLARAMFLVICALNIGSWIYTSKTAFLFLGCFMGYSMMLSRSIRETQHTTAT